MNLSDSSTQSHNQSIPRLTGDVALFFVAGFFVFIVTRFGVPSLARFGVDKFAAWMFLSVLFVFTPIIAGGVFLLRTENTEVPLKTRLRLQSLTKRDWQWVFLAVIIIGVTSLGLKILCDKIGLSVDPFDRQPAPWTKWWMFALWAIYWPVNILGEEFTWRGVILPRMERRMANKAWALNSLLWVIFHAGFNIGTILVTIPTIILVPLLSQKTKNTWVAVILHAVLSLPGMIAISRGLV